MPKTIFSHGLPAVLALCLGLVANVAAQTAPRPANPSLDRVVAVVNDEVITARELQQRVAMAEQQLRRQRIAPPPAAVLQRQVLERMIVERAQLQLARETGVRVDDATVNAAIARIAEANRMSLPEFRARLEQDGVSFARFREEVRDDIIFTRLREREVEGRIVVAEGEIDNFLAAQKGGGASSANAEYNIAQILLRVPENASAERIDEVRRRAEQLVAQLKGGADFAALAASSSARKAGCKSASPPENVTPPPDWS